MTTSLSAECDVGEHFENPKSYFFLDACLKDLCINPMRLTSWRQLHTQLMDAFNYLCDELQKAAHDKINLSKTKLNEFRSEIQNVMREIESNGKLAHT